MSETGIETWSTIAARQSSRVEPTLIGVNLTEPFRLARGGLDSHRRRRYDAERDKCKSTTLTFIANADKSRLKCYAKAAKTGQPVDTNCLTPYQQLITVAWIKLGASLPSCPLFPSYPTSAAVDGLIDGLSANLVTALPLGGTTGAWKCASKKFKAASLRSVNTLKCWSKAYQQNVSVDPICLTKVDLKYNQAFARAEAPLQCDPGNVGNAAAVATLIDNFVTDGMNGVVDLIPPP